MPWGLRVTRIGNWKTEPRSPLWLCLPGSFAWGLPVSLLRGPQGHRSVDSSLPLSFHSVRLASWSEGPSCLFLLYPSQKILQVNILHLISVSHLGVRSSEDLNSTPLLLSPPLWAAATSFLVKVNLLWHCLGKITTPISNFLCYSFSQVKLSFLLLHCPALPSQVWGPPVLRTVPRGAGNCCSTFPMDVGVGKREDGGGCGELSRYLQICAWWCKPDYFLKRNTRFKSFWNASSLVLQKCPILQSQIAVTSTLFPNSWETAYYIFWKVLASLVIQNRISYLFNFIFLLN